MTTTGSLSTLVRDAGTCRHCGQTLHHRPDPDPTDPETCEIWVGVEADGTLGIACHAIGADQHPCDTCSGHGEDEDGYECESCDGRGVTADHTPATNPGAVWDELTWERAPAAAHWSAGRDTAVGPTVSRATTGRAPRMTHLGWWRSQGVDLGSTDQHEHYWRCPVCRWWAGGYADLADAKEAGMRHRSIAHRPNR